MLCHYAVVLHNYPYFNDCISDFCFILHIIWKNSRPELAEIYSAIYSCKSTFKKLIIMMLMNIGSGFGPLFSKSPGPLLRCQSTPDCSQDQRSSQESLSSLEVLFNLNAGRKLLSLSKKLSKVLQAVGSSADYALYSVRHVIHRFKEMRCAEEFESILKEAKDVLGSTDDVDSLRQSKIPRRLDDSVIACYC